MQISWLGYNAFRITSGGVTVLTNPVEPSVGFQISRQSADVVVMSSNGIDIANAVSGSPMIICEPGEYESKSIFVYGKQYGSQTMYQLTIEDMSIAFIGSVKIREATNSTLELIEGCDLLIVPVGGGAVCSAKDAVQLINQIEPRVVIPSYYKTKGSKGIDGVDVFLKEYSAPSEEIDKLKLVKSALPQEDTRVMVISRS